MSMELMVAAMKTKVGNPLRKLVLIKLADNASDQGECWPSYQHIADQCEISRKSVIRHVDALVDDGYLRKEMRSGPKGNSSNLYYLNIGKIGQQEKPRVAKSPHRDTDSPDGDTESLGGRDTESPRISNSFDPVSEPVKEPKDLSSSDDVRAVFDHWRQVMRKPNTKLTPKRRDKIKARLRDGYTVQDICLAIDNCSRSSFHMGQNDTGGLHNDLELICRSADKLEWFMYSVGTKRPETQHGKQRQPDNFGQIDYRAGAEEMGFEVI